MNVLIETPPVWRVLAAFVIAPLPAALLLACYEPLYGGMDMAFRIWHTFLTFLMFGAYPPVLLFGLPAYAILRNRVRPTVLNCAMTGAIVAALPWLLLLLLGTIESAGAIHPPGYGGDAYAGGHVTERDGHVTFWGVVEGTEMVRGPALMGALAGGVFWLVAAPDMKRSGVIDDGLRAET